MNSVTAVVLGGGRGTRLFPLTLERAKPAVSVVGRGTRMSDAVMMGEDFYEGEQVLGRSDQPTGEVPPLGVDRSCNLDRVIIDKNARIGDGVVIRPRPEVEEHESELYWVRDGITIIPKGTVIPSGTVI